MAGGVSASAKKNPKKRKSKVLDQPPSFEPTDVDFLFGGGGHATTNSGTVRFREEFLSLRPRYQHSQTTKEEKVNLAEALYQFVEQKGGRFLKRRSDNKDKKWYIVDKGEAMKMISRALVGRFLILTNVCTPSDFDVLFGRGGETNTHPGNKRYLKKRDKLSEWYGSIPEGIEYKK